MLGALVLGALATAGYWVWDARALVSRLSDEAAIEGRIAFQARELSSEAAISSLERGSAGRLSGVEAVAAEADFVDLAAYEGRLYVAATSALMVSDDRGGIAQTYRVGRELPAAPIVALAVGAAPGSSRPTLFAASGGAGLLLMDLERRSWRQIFPDDADAGDLTAVLPLASGRVLLGTARSGLLSFDGESLSVFLNELKNSRVTALAGDDSEIWIGTQQRGVWRWSADGLRNWSTQERLPDPQVLSLERRDGRVFCGTPLGVAEFRDGELTRVLADGFFAQSLAGGEDELLVGTLDEGVARVPLGARRIGFAAAGGAWPGGEARRLLRRGDVVYAVARDGVYVSDSEREDWRRVISPPAGALRDGNISALARDEQGRLWVGYFDRGLDIVEANGEVRTSIEDDTVFCVNRIAHDRERSLTAVATANGLILFDENGRRQQTITREDGLISSHVSDVVFRGGGLAAATSSGISFIDGSGIRSVNAFHGLVNNHVYALGLEGERLLAGTLGGLSVLDGETLRGSHTTANSPLGHNWITAIDAAGGEWFVGTYGGGVARIGTNGEWRSYSADFGGVEVNPNALIATGGRVYAGTLGGGLFVLDRAADRWFSFAEGLPSTNVTALELADGALWIGTDNGLVRVREEFLGGAR